MPTLQPVPGLFLYTFALIPTYFSNLIILAVPVFLAKHAVPLGTVMVTKTLIPTFSKLM